MAQSDISWGKPIKAYSEPTQGLVDSLVRAYSIAYSKPRKSLELFLECCLGRIRTDMRIYEVVQWSLEGFVVAFISVEPATAMVVL